MDPNLALFISTGIATVVATIVSVTITKATIRSEKATQLSERVAELNRLAIEHPYFEDDKFCNNLPSLHAKYNERYLQYENYCCLVFNLLEAIWLHCRGNESKMARLAYPPELILRHKRWWQSPIEYVNNVSGYDKGFRGYVDRIIKANMK